MSIIPYAVAVLALILAVLYLLRICVRLGLSWFGAAIMAGVTILVLVVVASVFAAVISGSPEGHNQAAVTAEPTHNKQSSPTTSRDEVHVRNKRESKMNALAGWVLFLNIIFFVGGIPLAVCMMRKRGRRRNNIRKIMLELDGISRVTPDDDEGDGVRGHIIHARELLKGMVVLAVIFAASPAAADWWNPGTWFTPKVTPKVTPNDEEPEAAVQAPAVYPGPSQVNVVTFVLASEKVVVNPDGTAEYRPTTTKGEELRFAGTKEECRNIAGMFIPGDELEYTPGGPLELRRRTSAFRIPKRQDMVIVQDGQPFLWQSVLRDIATLRAGEVITKLRVQYDAPEFSGGKNQVVVEIRKREEAPAREFLKNMKAGLVTFWLVDYADVVELPASFDMKPPTAYTAGYRSTTSISTKYPLVQYDDWGEPYIVTVPEGIKFNDMVVLRGEGFPTAPAVGLLEPGKVTWPGDRSRIDARIRQRLGGPAAPAGKKAVCDTLAQQVGDLRDMLCAVQRNAAASSDSIKAMEERIASLHDAVRDMPSVKSSIDSLFLEIDNVQKDIVDLARNPKKFRKDRGIGK